MRNMLHSRVLVSTSIVYGQTLDINLQDVAKIVSFALQKNMDITTTNYDSDRLIEACLGQL